MKLVTALGFFFSSTAMVVPPWSSHRWLDGDCFTGYEHSVRVFCKERECLCGAQHYDGLFPGCFTMGACQAWVHRETEGRRDVWEQRSLASYT